MRQGREKRNEWVDIGALVCGLSIVLFGTSAETQVEDCYTGLTDIEPWYGRTTVN